MEPNEEEPNEMEDPEVEYPEVEPAVTHYSLASEMLETAHMLANLAIEQDNNTVNLGIFPFEIQTVTLLGSIAHSLVSISDKLSVLLVQQELERESVTSQVAIDVAAADDESVE